MRLPALNFEARVLAPLSCPLLDLSQATSLQEKKVGPAGLTLQGPLRYPHGTGSQLSRISGRPSAGGPPHLEEGGARPRRDVTAPGTRGGSLGGARGPQGAWPGKPRPFSRDFAPAGSRFSSPRARGFHLVLERGALRLRLRGSGCGLSVRDPAGASADGERKQPGERGPVRTVRRRGSCSPPLARAGAEAAAEAGREELRSSPLAGGWRRLPGAPEPVHRRGRSLPARAAAWVSITARPPLRSSHAGPLQSGSPLVGACPGCGARTRDRLPRALWEPPTSMVAGSGGAAIANLTNWHLQLCYSVAWYRLIFFFF